MEIQAARGAAVDALDYNMMQKALAAARHAVTLDEVPVGAVLACGGDVLAIAHNAAIGLSDPTAHAEILALREAAARVGNYRLPGTTLYVTLEPCLMCAGALVQARVMRVVFGCADPKNGALGSAHDVGRDGRGNHRLQVTPAVCAEDGKVLLTNFFRTRRGA